MQYLHETLSFLRFEQIATLLHFKSINFLRFENLESCWATSRKQSFSIRNETSDIKIVHLADS